MNNHWSNNIKVPVSVIHRGKSYTNAKITAFPNYRPGLDELIIDWDKRTIEIKEIACVEKDLDV